MKLTFTRPIKVPSGDTIPIEPEASWKKKDINNTDNNQSRLKNFSPFSNKNQIPKGTNAFLTQMKGHIDFQNALKKRAAFDASGQYSQKNLTVTTTKKQSFTGTGHDQKCKYSDENLKGELQPLGAGAFNKVFLATYKVDGKNIKYVYKPTPSSENANSSELARLAGIPSENPRFIERNKATYLINKMLNWDVIPYTDDAIHNNVKGMVMARAPGRTAYDAVRRTGMVDAKEYEEKFQELEKLYGDKDIAKKQMQILGYSTQTYWFGPNRYSWNNPNRANFESAVAKRELVKLQLVDHITGQLDRHADNYLVDTDNKGNVTSVKGIDNDFSFGETATERMKMVHPEDFRCGYARVLKLPEVVDTDMVQAIETFDFDKFEASSKELLTPGEIKATHKRLAALKKHFEELIVFGGVIKPSEWGSANLIHKDRSYVARDGRF